MKIMRLCSGLGNTMFQYAAYLQLKAMYPEENVFVDTMWFDFTKYPLELERVFGIDIKRIDFYEREKKSYDYESAFNNLQFDQSEDYVSFARHHPALVANCNFLEIYELYKRKYPNLQILSSQQVSINDIKSILKNGQEEAFQDTTKTRAFIKSLWKDKNALSYRVIAALSKKYTRKKILSDVMHRRKPDYTGFPPVKRLKQKGDVFYNIYGFPSDCKGIRRELLRIFSFPPFDEINQRLAEDIHNHESVAIHARVRDFEYGMKEVIERNYFSKAIKYFQGKTTKEPKYYVFSDNIEWCKNNLSTFGLNENSKVYFVENNTGENSYRDMQLMTQFKYLIIPNSTFSWWGGYLSQEKGKILVTPYATLPGTINF